MTARARTLEVVDRYLRAIERKDAEAVALCLSPDVVQHEYPNQLVTSGASRSQPQILDGLARGAEVVSHERYEIEDALVDGDKVACRVRWTAELRVPVLGREPGTQLEARFGVFFRLAGGLIVEQHNYDCFYVE